MRTWMVVPSGNGHGADQIADAVHQMEAAQEVLVAVVAVDERPDGARVLAADEGEFFAVGLEQAAGAFAVGPAGVRIEMVRP